MWSNEIKYKYMFMFPLKKLAPKGLKQDCGNSSAFSTEVTTALP